GSPPDRPVGQDAGGVSGSSPVVARSAGIGAGWAGGGAYAAMISQLVIPSHRMNRPNRMRLYTPPGANSPVSMRTDSPVPSESTNNAKPAFTNEEGNVPWGAATTAVAARRGATANHVRAYESRRMS